MRTTIEITVEQRARLLEISARRGLKGFSAVIQEALDAYLQGQAGHSEDVRLALAAIGSIDDKAADALHAASKRSRASWR
jgi:hypothetical protein